MTKSGSSSSGLGVGSVIAGIISWVHWHSLGWCIIHVVLGWVYIFYYLIRYGLR